MYIRDDIRKCVVFIGLQMADGTFQLKGSAFYIGRSIDGTDKIHSYLVTARHVIEGIRNRGLSEVCVRANFKDGQAQWLYTMVSDWHFHAHGPQVDVAVARVGLLPEMDHKIINEKQFAVEEAIAKNRIGVGDEVFLTGLFVHHHGQSRNIPIVRVGNIAAMPELPVQSRLGPMDAYLIEARSIGGLSGSPVFVNLGLHREFDGQIVHAQSGPITYLLGVMEGHFDGLLMEQDEVPIAPTEQSRVNMGIGIVVPIQKVLEVVEQPEIRRLDERYEEIILAKTTAPLSDPPAID